MSDWQGVLDHAQAEGRLPSVAAGVLTDGQLTWTGSAGAETGPAVQYRIGSITKTMTAALVLQCRDEGRLALTDPIGRWVPETGYRDATVGALLSHTSGMQSEPVGSWWERSPGVDFARLVATNHAPIAEPGEYFHYSNLGYALLGEAVARLAGMTWWELVSARLLGPLGMRQTSYHRMDPATQGYSVHHFAGTLTPEPHRDTAAMAPAGQLWSTVEDLTRWGAFLASGHPGILATSTLRKMARPVIASEEEYGLGLRQLEVDGHLLVGHTGSMPGFVATLFVEQESGDGVIALANATTGISQTTLAAELWRGQPSTDVIAWRPSVSVPERVAQLLGLWYWGNSAVELRWHNGLLELHSLALRMLEDRFDVTADHIVGTAGYHRGETLHVLRRADGSLSHLECATFVFTRTPYDPTVPIPGGSPESR
ncbi:MAG: beta-lactamase family protein [Actinomycetota bacterium]|nr:beta-lactamase family protein [Actinomycetota bacterium]